MTIDLAGPFRGTEAVAAGLLTPGVLRGPRYRRLFPDIYVAAWRELDLTLRSMAAYLLVAGRGVLAGYSAAELLRASCGPPAAPATVLMIPGRQRGRCPGLLVRRGPRGADHLDPDRARRDLEREALLTRLGWTVLRFDAATVYRDPARVVTVVRAELRRRGVAC